jgi:Transposase DDE domain
VVKHRYVKMRAMRRARGERLEARLKVRRWQKACDAEDPNENAGSRVDAPLEAVEQMPAGLGKLPRPAREKIVRSSVTDPDARFLRSRGGRFVLGYTAEIAVSNDHLIVAQRVTQEATDNASLDPMVDLIEATCAEPPGAVVADSGYYSNWNVERMQQRGVDAYVPDSNMARELNLGHKANDLRCTDPRHIRMRQKMRSERGTNLYRKRKALVEPVFGVLKTQRNLNSFRMRSLDKVATEFTLAAIAYNLTRLHNLR